MPQVGHDQKNVNWVGAEMRHDHPNVCLLMPQMRHDQNYVFSDKPGVWTGPFSGGLGVLWVVDESKTGEFRSLRMVWHRIAVFSNDD